MAWRRPILLILALLLSSCLKSGPDQECGNGIVEPPEQCDCSTGASPYPAGCPGPNANTGDTACRTDCTLPGDASELSAQ